MRIAIGSDHRGLKLKQGVAGLLAELGHTYEDMGCYDGNSVDYPDVAARVAESVASGQYEAGILVCGTGIGMSIAANKVPGIRAALVRDTHMARMAREHNDANVLCLGGDLVSEAEAREIVKAYLGATFEGGRHSRRVNKISELEKSRGQNASQASKAGKV